MSDLIEPPIPDDVDLRNLEWMPLHIDKLVSSRAWRDAKRRPDLAFFMMNLWMAAWKEVPAGSLPNDDRTLREIAGCSPQRWPTARQPVLRSFVAATNARIYHPTIVEEAIRAWELKTSRHAKMKDARKAKAAKRIAQQNQGLRRQVKTLTQSLTQTLLQDQSKTLLQEQSKGLSQLLPYHTVQAVGADAPPALTRSDESSLVRSREQAQDWPSDWLEILQGIAKPCQGGDQAIALGVGPLLELGRKGIEWQVMVAGVTAAAAKCAKLTSITPILSFIEGAERQLTRAREIGQAAPKSHANGAPEEMITIVAPMPLRNLLGLIDIFAETGTWPTGTYAGEIAPGDPGCRIPQRYWPAAMRAGKDAP